MVAKAHATLKAPFSANSLICTVIRRNCGVTKRIIAEMAVMLRTKAVTRPLRNESFISGSVTVIKTLKLSAPISYADSSMLLSICLKAEMPLRVPVGRLRTTNTIIRINAVPEIPCKKPLFHE